MEVIGKGFALTRVLPPSDRGAMRVVSNDQIRAVCGSLDGLEHHFGTGAPAVALAISTLRAVRTMVEFLALPNVNKEKDVIFSTPHGDVYLGLRAFKNVEGACVEVTSVRVGRRAR